MSAPKTSRESQAFAAIPTHPTPPNPMSTGEPLLSPAELAKALGCHRASVYRMASRGYIPVYRLGASLKFRLSEVLNHLAAGPRDDGGR